jgi:hypothetical protein
MYRFFAENGQPLPKDTKIIESYGFSGEEEFF